MFAVSGDCCDAGSDTEAYGFEVTQFIHHRKDILAIRSLWVENGLGVVEDYEHILGGEGGPQGCQTFRVYNRRTDDCGETSEKMSARSGKLVATNESTVIAEPFLDTVVVKDSEGDGCFPDAPCANKGSRFEIFDMTNDLLDEPIAPEKGLRRRGRRFSGRDARKT